MKIYSLTDGWRNIIGRYTEIRAHVLPPNPVYLQCVSAPDVHGPLLMMIGSDSDLASALASPDNLGTWDATCVTRESCRVLVLVGRDVTGSTVGIYIRWYEDTQPRGLGGHGVSVDLTHVQTSIITCHLSS